MVQVSSIFTPLLVLSILHTSLSYNVIESISDTISAGSVIHYTLSSTNTMVVILVSEVGDVDLYASPTSINSKPSSEDYEISSASCGLDVLPLIMSNSVQKYTLAVYGHVRYDKSHFSLYVIEPSMEDIRKYQVWDWDPEKSREVLLIDADPMVLVNSPQLTEMIESMSVEGPAGVGRTSKGSNSFKDIVEFMGIVFLKLCEILIEVLV